MKILTEPNEDIEAIRLKNVRHSVRLFYPSATETELENLARELIEANLAHLREIKEHK